LLEGEEVFGNGSQEVQTLLQVSRVG